MTAAKLPPVTGFGFMPEPDARQALASWDPYPVPDAVIVVEVEGLDSRGRWEPVVDLFTIPGTTSTVITDLEHARRYRARAQAVDPGEVLDAAWAQAIVLLDEVRSWPT